MQQPEFGRFLKWICHFLLGRPPYLRAQVTRHSSTLEQILRQNNLTLEVNWLFLEREPGLYQVELVTKQSARFA